METDGNTALNAVIGAVATVVLSWLPFSPVIGGALAGYLQGGDVADGAVVGALTGFLAAIPSIGIVLLVLVVVPFVPDLLIGVSIAAVALLVVVAIFAYWVAFGALGGAIGIYVREEVGERKERRKQAYSR